MGDGDAINVSIKKGAQGTSQPRQQAIYQQRTDRGAIAALTRLGTTLEQAKAANSKLIPFGSQASVVLHKTPDITHSKATWIEYLHIGYAENQTYDG